MAKLIDLMRQAGVQWPEGAEYAAQDSAGQAAVNFFQSRPKLAKPRLGVWIGASDDDPRWPAKAIEKLADDWRTPVTRYEWFDCPPQSAGHTCPNYMREQQRLASRSQERRNLVRELMLRHPELTGSQAIEQADEILETLEGLK